MARSARKRTAPSREGILEAAEALFAERGFGEPSLRDLISACGCSTTAFYARFDSKDAVLAALLDEWVGELVSAATEALPRAKTVEDGFAIGVDVLLDAVRDRKGLVRLFLCEAPCSGSRDLIRTSYNSLSDLLAWRLEKMVARGESALQNPRQYAWALVGAVNVQLMRWAVFDELDDAELEDALRATAQTMLTGALATS